MGLDVYLTRYTNRGDTKERERLYEERMTPVYDRDAPEDESERERKRIAEELGLDEWGSDERNTTSVQEPSAIDPEHYFKVGYFRSSYNESGINTYLGRVLGGGGLYSVFPEAGDVYEFQPDWAAAKQRALNMAAALHDRAQSRPYDVTVVRGSLFWSEGAVPASANEALEVFCTQKPHPCAAYSSAQGEFFMKEPLPVRALIRGTREGLRGAEPVLYVVFDAPDEHKWHETALRIVAETCDYVLRQPDPQNYWLRWSA